MTSQALRIGLFTPAWPGSNTPNGIATSVYFLAEGLREIGHMPVIVAMQQDGQGPADIPVVQVSEGRGTFMDRLRVRVGDSEGWHRPAERRVAAAVSQAAREHGLDVLIMEETQGWSHGVQAQTGIPVVVTLHGPWLLHKAIQGKGAADHRADQKREAREARAFQAAHGLLSPSHNVLQAVRDGVDVGKVPGAVIANAVAGAGSDVAALSADPQILFIGRFDRHKGGDVVLQAFDRLIQTHPTARLTFAGPDRGLRGADGTLTQIDDALGALSERARAGLDYIGPATREQVAELRKSHALVLVASRYENLNYTLLEAMAAGQAIVSTAVGGPAEVLRDGETALLVPSEDPAAMAAALGRLLDDATLTARLGRNAAQTIARDFSPAAIARQTVAFLREHVTRNPD